MMAASRTIAVVNDYPALQRVLRQRAEDLKISRETLDALAGISEGHSAKMLTDPPRKNMGILTFGLLLRALGLQLVVIEDDEQMRKLASRIVRRDESQVRHRKQHELANDERRRA
jgi:hypothetical protein